MDFVNIFAPEIRGKVRKEVDFVPGAWVEFWDDLTAGSTQKMISLDKTEANTLEDVYKVLLDQIADWNFGDTNGQKLPVNYESFSKLSTKFLFWIRDQVREILSSASVEDKKKD